VHLIHHHHFVRKKATDAVKIDRDTGIIIAIILDPFYIVIERIKAPHQPACAGILHIALTAGVVDQLQFVDAEGNEISHVGRRRISQAGVKFDTLPLRRVVAGGSNDQTGNFVRRNHFGLIKNQSRGGHVARTDMHLEAIGKAGFRGPLGDYV